MYFNEDKHIYTHKQTKEVYTSVTTVISSYKQPFDAESISEQYIKDHPEIQEKEGAQLLIDKYCLDITVEEFLSEPITSEKLREYWRKASVAGIIKGNNYHFRREMEINAKFNPNLPEDYNDYIMTLDELANIPDGVYPELRVWSDKYKIAGTSDIVIVERPYVDVLDHKTNKNKIYQKVKRANNMLYPLDYLQDIAYNHYSTQLGIYAFMLEQLGFKPRRIEIQHKRFLDNDKIPSYYKLPWESEKELKKLIKIPVQYYPMRIENFLEYDSRKRNR